MKIILHDKTSKKFWGTDGDLCANPNEALDFESAAQAQQFCRTRGYKNTDVLILFNSLGPIRISCDN